MPVSDDVALVFDLDNTLVHSQIDFPRMRQRVIDVVLGGGMRLPTEPPLASLATAEIIDIALQHGAPPGLIESIWAAVTEEETRGMERASVEDDALAALMELRSRGVAIGLLTNNGRAAAVAALERFDLLRQFDLVLARDDVPALKPSPAGLLVALDRMTPARRVAMIGDASIDGLAANRASVPFVAFRPSEADLDRRGVERWATVHALSEVTSLLPHLPRLEAFPSNRP